ncbi:hypothetical protein V8F33_009348 [Rhypophila sp. PSN 637]
MIYISGSSRNSIWWSQIVKVVAPAQVDVLFLINRCHAGSAYISHEGTGIRYAKEVISFAGWNQLIYQTMNLSPLSEGLRRWFRETTIKDLSGSMLYEYIADGIRDARDNGPKDWQKYHNHPIYRQRCDRPQHSLQAGKPGINWNGATMNPSQIRQWRLSRPMTSPDAENLTPEMEEVTLGVEEMLSPPRRKRRDLVGLDKKEEGDKRPLIELDEKDQAEKDDKEAMARVVLEGRWRELKSYWRVVGEKVVYYC